MTVELRPYQHRTLERARDAYRRGARRILVVSPTGSGKTAMGSAFVDSAVERGNRVLWLAHRRELIAQASERLDTVGCTRHGVILAGHPRVRPTAPIQVASIQTLHARRERPPADLVVWDEAHHAAAATYGDVRAAYPHAVHLGLTATPERSDGAPMGDSFDALVEGATIAELIEGGWLVPCDVIGATPASGLAADPVHAWESLAQGRPTIVFAANVPHSRAITSALQARGVSAEHLDGTTPWGEREAILRRFRDGRTTVLSNVYVLTEGFDAPRAEVCLLARGASHASIYLQMVGRVLRPAPGKSRALLIDLRGVAEQHGLPDCDRVYSLDGEAIRPRDAAEQVRQCPECGGCDRPRPSCARCGFVFPPPKEPTIEPRELRPILRPNATREQQQAAFDRLVGQARANGYKTGWVGHRFKATFGFWPGGLRASKPADVDTEERRAIEREHEEAGA